MLFGLFGLLSVAITLHNTHAVKALKENIMTALQDLQREVAESVESNNRLLNSNALLTGAVVDLRSEVGQIRDLLATAVENAENNPAFAEMASRLDAAQVVATEAIANADAALNPGGATGATGPAGGGETGATGATGTDEGPTGSTGGDEGATGTTGTDDGGLFEEGPTGTTGTDGGGETGATATPELI